MLLWMTHNALAVKTEIPELAMEKEEARMLAEAVANVAQHYEIMQTVSPEMVAWFGLLQTVGLVYGTRGVAYVSRKRMEKANATV